MSEKKTKEQRFTVQYPVYDAEKNVQFLTEFSKMVDMSVDDILNLVVGDWIITLCIGTFYKDPRDVFYSFVASTKTRSDEYKKQQKILNSKREVSGGKDNA